MSDNLSLPPPEHLVPPPDDSPKKDEKKSGLLNAVVRAISKATPEAVKQKLRIGDIRSKAGEVSDGIKLLMKRQDALYKDIYQNISPDTKFDLEGLDKALSFQNDERTAIEQNIASLQQSLPNIKDTHQAISIREQINSAKLQLSEIEKKHSQIRDILNSPTFKVLAPFRKLMLQNCITITSSKKSPEQKFNELNAQIIAADAFLKGLETPLSDLSKRMAHDTLNYLKGSLHSVLADFEKTQKKPLFGTPSRESTTIYLDLASDIKEKLAELQGKIDEYKPAARQASQLNPDTASYLRKLQLIGKQHAGASFQASKFSSIFRHYTVSMAASRASEKAQLLLSVGSDMEKHMKALAAGTKKANFGTLQAEINTYEQAIISLEEDLAKQKEIIESRHVSSTQAEALGFIDRWEEKIGELKGKLEILKVMNTLDYQKMIELEQGITKELKKAANDPLIAGMIVDQTLSAAKEVMQEVMDKIAEKLPGDLERIQSFCQARIDISETLNNQAQRLLEPTNQEAKLKSDLFEGRKSLDHLSQAEVEIVRSIFAKLLVQQKYFPSNAPTDLNRLHGMLFVSSLTRSIVNNSGNAFNRLYLAYTQSDAVKPRTSFYEACARASQGLFAANKLYNELTTSNPITSFEKAKASFDEISKKVAELSAQDDPNKKAVLDGIKSDLAKLQAKLDEKSQKLLAPTGVQLGILRILKEGGLPSSSDYFIDSAADMTQLIAKQLAVAAYGKTDQKVDARNNLQLILPRIPQPHLGSIVNAIRSKYPELSERCASDAEMPHTNLWKVVTPTAQATVENFLAEPARLSPLQELRNKVLSSAEPISNKDFEKLKPLLAEEWAAFIASPQQVNSKLERLLAALPEDLRQEIIPDKSQLPEGFEARIKLCQKCNEIGRSLQEVREAEVELRKRALTRLPAVSAATSEAKEQGYTYHNARLALQAMLREHAANQSALSIINDLENEAKLLTTQDFMPRSKAKEELLEKITSGNLQDTPDDHLLHSLATLVSGEMTRAIYLPTGQGYVVYAELDTIFQELSKREALEPVFKLITQKSSTLVSTFVENYMLNALAQKDAAFGRSLALQSAQILPLLADIPVDATQARERLQTAKNKLHDAVLNLRNNPQVPDWLKPLLTADTIPLLNDQHREIDETLRLRGIKLEPTKLEVEELKVIEAKALFTNCQVMLNRGRKDPDRALYSYIQAQNAFAPLEELAKSSPDNHALQTIYQAAKEQLTSFETELQPITLTEKEQALKAALLESQIPTDSKAHLKLRILIGKQVAQIQSLKDPQMTRELCEGFENMLNIINTPAEGKELLYKTFSGDPTDNESRIINAQLSTYLASPHSMLQRAFSEIKRDVQAKCASGDINEISRLNQLLVINNPNVIAVRHGALSNIEPFNKISDDERSALISSIEKQKNDLIEEKMKAFFAQENIQPIVSGMQRLASKLQDYPRERLDVAQARELDVLFSSFKAQEMSLKAQAGRLADNIKLAHFGLDSDTENAIIKAIKESPLADSLARARADMVALVLKQESPKAMIDALNTGKTSLPNSEGVPKSLQSVVFDISEQQSLLQELIDEKAELKQILNLQERIQALQGRHMTVKAQNELLPKIEKELEARKSNYQKTFNKSDASFEKQDIEERLIQIRHTCEEVAPSIICLILADKSSEHLKFTAEEKNDIGAFFDSFRGTERKNLQDLRAAFDLFCIRPKDKSEAACTKEAQSLIGNILEDLSSTPLTVNTLAELSHSLGSEVGELINPDPKSAERVQFEQIGSQIESNYKKLLHATEELERDLFLSLPAEKADEVKMLRQAANEALAAKRPRPEIDALRKKAIAIMKEHADLPRAIAALEKHSVSYYDALAELITLAPQANDFILKIKVGKEEAELKALDTKLAGIPTIKKTVDTYAEALGKEKHTLGIWDDAFMNILRLSMGSLPQQIDSMLNSSPNGSERREPLLKIHDALRANLERVNEARRQWEERSMQS